MQYRDLHELIQASQSSRAFFLSLPVESQRRLHEYNAYIHSATELRRAAADLSIAEWQAALGGWR